MRIVIALGGNALLRRGDPMTVEVQRRNVKIAAEAIAPLADQRSIKAAARFVVNTGGRAAIGSLADIAGIVAGTAGTNVVKDSAPADAALGVLAPAQKEAQRSCSPLSSMSPPRS